ncbi:MAG: phosphatidylserine/phosphatidylglycerophosphate/cardiolipin synthase family protein [Bdellovibrio sp.]|nr:phosphatidylserine/phosphatidylglycerophosphate/cardiolipin synthase family protein [Bdellovibrio sp.]
MPKIMWPLIVLNGFLFSFLVLAQESTTPDLAEVLGYVLNKSSLDEITKSQETNNKATLLHLGVNSKRARIKLLADAKEYVFITVPYWYGDDEGKAMYHELKSLKERNPNIDIKIMVDWTSPASTGDFFASKMYLQLKKLVGRKNIVQWNKFWNFRGFSFKLAENRIHDKVFVVDGDKLIMGGMNIGSEYLQGGLTKVGWHDTDILFEGPVAQVATKVFIKPFLLQKHLDKLGGNFPTDPRMQLKVLHYYFYYDIARIPYRPAGFLRTEKVVDLPLGHFLGNPRYFPLVGENEGHTTPVRLIYDNPFVDRKFVKNKIMHASKTLDALEFILPHAKHSMRLFIPYLTLSDRMIKILQKAATRIKVQIITNSLKSHDLGKFNFYAALPTIQRLVDAGIEVYAWQGHKDLLEFEKKNNCEIDDYWPGRTLHTKAVILDRSVAILGSNNMNVRSEKHNSEIMALIRDREIAKQLDDVFEYDLDKSPERTLSCGGKIFADRPPRVLPITKTYLDTTVRGLKFRIYPSLYDFL